MILIPKFIFKKIDSMLFAYLWDSKPHKIKRSSIIAPIDQGGLGMLDVDSIHIAAKCSWICRLCDDNNSKWKTLSWKLINLEP